MTHSFQLERCFHLAGNKPKGRQLGSPGDLSLSFGSGVREDPPGIRVLPEPESTSGRQTQRGWERPGRDWDFETHLHLKCTNVRGVGRGR